MSLQKTWTKQHALYRLLLQCLFVLFDKWKFGCIDFQWKDVNDEKVMKTVICASNMGLEWHKNEKISFGWAIPLKLPRLASWNLPSYNLYSTRDSKLPIVFLYHLFTVVVLTGKLQPKIGLQVCSDNSKNDLMGNANNKTKLTIIMIHAYDKKINKAYKCLKKERKMLLTSNAVHSVSTFSMIAFWCIYRSYPIETDGQVVWCKNMQPRTYWINEYVQNFRDFFVLFIYFS